MARTPVEKTITLQWRNEGYGSVSSDAVAFRKEIEPFPSETENKRVARIFKKHGFELNFSRQAWIAEFRPEETPILLIEALEEAGYTVVNTGAEPEIVQLHDLNKGKIATPAPSI